MKSYASRMIKKLIPFSIAALNAACSFGQRSAIDSLEKRFLHESNDTIRTKLLYSLGSKFIVLRIDSAIYYLAQSIELAEKINYPLDIHAGYIRLAFGLNTVSNYSEALKMAQKSLLIAEKFRNDSLRRMSIAESYHIMGG